MVRQAPRRHLRPGTDVSPYRARAPGNVTRRSAVRVAEAWPHSYCSLPLALQGPGAMHEVRAVLASAQSPATVRSAPPLDPRRVPRTSPAAAMMAWPTSGLSSPTSMLACNAKGGARARIGRACTSVRPAAHCCTEADADAALLASLIHQYQHRRKGTSTCLRGGALDVAQRHHQLVGHALGVRLANLEVEQRTLRLRAPQPARGHLDLAQGVVLQPGREGAHVAPRWGACPGRGEPPVQRQVGLSGCGCGAREHAVLM